MHLSSLDWIVVSCFVAAILALGFSAKLRDNSILQFLAAGRSLTLPVFVAALVSTWYGGILGVGESVSYFGVGTWVLLGLPYYVFAYVYAFYFAERVRGAEDLSIPERLHRKYGKGVGLLGAALVFLLAVPAAHVLMLGVLVQAVSGWSTVAALLVGALIGISFLYKGGLLADARVSLLAFTMMYIGFAVIVGWCLLKYPLVPTMSKFKGTDFLKWDGGTGIPYVISFLILGAWTLIDPGFHQRVASSDSPRTSKRGVLVSIVFWFIFDVLTTTTGMYALALQTKAPANPVEIFPAFGDQILPSGLKAIFFCGMFGTITSAMVGYTLVSGTTIGREFIGRLNPDLDDRAITQWSRLGIVIACACAIVLALSINSVVNLWYAWGGVVIGALLIPVSISYGIGERSKASARSVFVSMAAASIGSLSLLVYGKTHGNDSLDFTFGGSKFSVGTLIPGLLISIVVIGIGEILARRRIANG